MLVDAGRLIGPAVAVMALIGLVLFTRWAFSGPRAPGPSAADDGLLTRVATLAHRESALQLRALLSDAGIRSTVRFPGAHRAEVLVFPEDAGRARELVAAFGSPE
ncbi:hypothetical protein [Blastococcus saxobsidens]|uniref:DUF2007 domain-containing protein n=1 Tax=Blastococcus saxobsidens TaxID=138336 RepID=A0A4Q7Y9M8_9ACTN|nr:hypothetical protein [Blastococcus saxobsidens]RZU32851.1 hypothetical protein BKA19_2560 [Blastococcus saxobsidens]